MILNVGIDIGISTIQFIFSRLTAKNRANSYTVPRVDIVDKGVIYCNKIYFTPLRSVTEIGAETVKRIVRKEYWVVGMTPGVLRTDAVIITGEAAREENASEVLEVLSDLAGDLVMVTVGSDLESVLSARGAGIDALSREERTAIANVDIGSGTGNITVYEKGVLRGTCCFGIDGRLIKVENGRTGYTFPKIQALAVANEISLAMGDRVYPEQLYDMYRLMAVQLVQTLRLAGTDSHYVGLYTSNGKPLPGQPTIHAVIYPSDVAGCIYQEMEGDVFRFGDIGILLGKAIRIGPDLGRVGCSTSIETIRATVIGMGTHTTEVSGSAIHYEQGTFPLKNILIPKVSEGDRASLETLKISILSQMPLYMPEGKAEQLVIALTGEKRTSFADIQVSAAVIIKSTKEVISSRYPLIVMVENDTEKMSGNTLNVLLKWGKDVICIDGIHTLSGDYIDVGEPIASGQMLPVIIKTLIFNS